jgi:hypothetical protein
MLLVEAAQGATRCDAGFPKEYMHRCQRKPKGVAKVAGERKLAIRLYWMLRRKRKLRCWEIQTNAPSAEASAWGPDCESASSGFVDYCAVRAVWTDPTRIGHYLKRVPVAVAQPFR